MGTDEGYTVAPRLLATVWSLAGITFFFLVARLYTRASIVGKVSADDYLLVISWVSNPMVSSRSTRGTKSVEKINWV